MSKGHSDLRVVVRENDLIIVDLHFDDFANAKPIYDVLQRNMIKGRQVSLQHGARIIFKSN